MLFSIINTFSGVKENILVEYEPDISTSTRDPEYMCILLQIKNARPVLNFHGSDPKIGDLNMKMMDESYLHQSLGLQSI